MIGTARATIGFLGAALATVPLATSQALVLRTGIADPAVLPRMWHRTLLRMLGVRVHVHGELVRERPLLLASNHISWTDIHVLGALADVAFVARADMARWPIVGALSRLQRTVFIERDRRATAASQVSEIGARLAAGDAVVFFAEGTTADGNRVLPFRSTLFGAAQTALRAGAGERVAVQPVAIAYTRLHGLPMGRQFRARAAWIGEQELLPHALGLLSEGAIDVEVHFGEPVEFRAGGDRKAVARETEARVRAMMARALRGAASG